jgi:hypothetical protein
MTTPKEKAEELAGKYWDLNYGWDGVTKDAWATEGALIAVDEILDAIATINEYDFEPLNNYWKEVKQELEKL